VKRKGELVAQDLVLGGPPRRVAQGRVDRPEIDHEAIAAPEAAWELSPVGLD